MNILEYAGLIGSAIGVAFGFGRQSSAIATLRRDNDAIARMHRETLAELQKISLRLERVETIVRMSSPPPERSA